MTEAEVRSNSIFSLTWSGLLIHSIQKKKENDVEKSIGEIEINREYDIVVRKYVTKNNVTKAVSKVQIGRLSDTNYGIRIRDDDGNTVLETDDNGSLWLRKSLSIGAGTKTNVKIGVLDNDQVFNANNNFIIYNNGTAKTTGDLTVVGNKSELWIKAYTINSSLGIGTVPGIYNYEKESNSIIGYISLENVGGANTIRLYSEGRNKNGDIVLKATNDLKLSGSNYIQLHDTRYMSIDILKDVSLTTGTLNINATGAIAIGNSDSVGSFSLKTKGIFSLDTQNVNIGNSCTLTRQVDDGYGAYILDNPPNKTTVKFGMSGATGHYCYIEHWNNDVMARLELYVNKDNGATLMLRSKKPNEKERSQPIAST